MCFLKRIIVPLKKTSDVIEGEKNIVIVFFQIGHVLLVDNI